MKKTATVRYFKTGKQTSRTIASRYQKRFVKLVDSHKKSLWELCRLLSQIKSECAYHGVPYKNTFNDLCDMTGINASGYYYELGRLWNNVEPAINELLADHQFSEEQVREYQANFTSSLVEIGKVGRSYSHLRKEMVKQSISQNLSRAKTQKMIQRVKYKPYNKTPRQNQVAWNDFKLYYVSPSKPLHGFKGIEDESVDLVVTSPPYNAGVVFDDYVTDKLPYKEYMTFNAKMNQAAFRVLKKGGLIIQLVNSAQIFPEKHPNEDFDGARLHGGLLKDAGFIFYDKKILHSPLREKKYLSNPNIPRTVHSCEYILFYSKGKYIGKPHETIEDKKQDFYALKIKNQVWENLVHPNTSDVPSSIFKCPFSISFCERIVLGYSWPGQLIVDPFAGSCNLGFTAVEHGRRFIGYESSKRQFNFISKRITDQNLHTQKPNPPTSFT